MAGIPTFYELLVEQKCPICTEEFILNAFPEVVVDNAIIFYKACYVHPCHTNCSLSYYESTDPDNRKTCIVCRADLGDFDRVIMTPMLPPSLHSLHETQSENLGDVPSLHSLQETQSENRDLGDVMLPSSLDAPSVILQRAPAYSLQETQSENHVLGDVMLPRSLDAPSVTQQMAPGYSSQETQSENSVLGNVTLPLPLDAPSVIQQRPPAC